MRATIQGLLFDKDGTLFDFAQSWGQCMANILGSLAPDAEQQQHLGQVVGFDLGQMRFARDSLYRGYGGRNRGCSGPESAQSLTGDYNCPDTLLHGAE